MAHLGQIDRRNPGDVVFTRYVTENADWNKLKIRIENGQFAEMFEDKNNEVVNIGNFPEKERIKETENAMINRASKYKKSRSSAILIKVLKYNQEKRIDRPTIGVKTIKQIAKSGFAGIVTEANEVLIIDYEKTIETADKNNIFIQGI